MAVKYNIQYTNHVGDDFQILILHDDYTSAPIELRGTAILQKPKTKIFHCLRGKALRLDLEANKNLVLTDLYSENETDYKVNFYRNNKILFTGFIKPDGLYQDWVSDKWVISLDCVDGLGILKNLRFVKENGTHYTGTMREIDIIRGCLRRTSMDLPINTAINIFHDGITDTDLDILDQTRLNTQRFIKDVSSESETEIMGCEEVLKSVLEKYNAVIEQFNGEWFIYRPIEIVPESGVLLGLIRFHHYSQGFYQGFQTLPITKSVGSHIDGYNIHHANENQRMMVSGAVSAFRVKYKYGLVKSFINNRLFKWDFNTLSIPGWIVNGNNLFNNLIFENGIRWEYDSVHEKSSYELRLEQPINVKEGDILEISGDYTSTGGLSNLPLRVYLEDEDGNRHYFNNDYPKYEEDGAFITYLKNAEHEFQIENTVFDRVNYGDTVQTILRDRVLGAGSITYSYKFTMPMDGHFNVEILAPVKYSNAFTDYSDSYAKLHSMNISAAGDDRSTEAESWTAYRKPANSSNVDDSIEVHNGDMESDIYVGVIKKLDGTNTSTWSRINRNEKKPLLQIMAEDRIRIQNKPQRIFSGDVYGYVPELTTISINNVGIGFFPMAYSYDSIRNICNFESIEIFNDELEENIETEVTYERGNVIKPTIEG